VKFSEIVDQAKALLKAKGRVSARMLRREFALDEETLQDLKFELVHTDRLAREEEGEVLVWAGTPSGQPVGSGEHPKVEAPVPSRSTPTGPSAEAERRQLTVMFCDLVGSTALSAQLDPEDYRAVVQQYQQTCTAVIQRHDGHIAQYLGDGLLVYFGHPTAHEDDARRAVRTGLESIEALKGQARPQPLQIRIGIHTGLVVIGEIGGSGRTEQLALGETPNVAARIQDLAEPNTVLISAATQRLIDGQFECQPFGSHLLKGIETPIAVHHVQSERQNASSFAGRTSLTPLGLVSQ
jgi:class 3 adenylate cyclase